jgi:hypothetical protein
MASRILLSWTAPAGAFEYRLYYGSAIWDGSSLIAADQYPAEMPAVKLPGYNQSVWVDAPSGATTRWAIISASRDGLISDISNLVAVTTPPSDRQAVVSVTGYSRRMALWTDPLDWISVVVEASVADPDGVDSVWVQLIPCTLDG